jgi:ABC-type branched-subunit amino acid transport system ATPase component
MLEIKNIDVLRRCPGALGYLFTSKKGEIVSPGATWSAKRPSAISGLLKPKRDGVSLRRKTGSIEPYQIILHGLPMFPRGRLFPNMTVWENLSVEPTSLRPGKIGPVRWKR